MSFAKLIQEIEAKGPESSIGPELFEAAMQELDGPDKPIAGFLKAVGNVERGGALLGMSVEDVAHYTRALAHSGRVFDFSEGGRYRVVAKHAPGGVAENTTGPVDCVLAAAGLRAPAITGERLGHTGGTVEKFHSIPGLNLWPHPEAFESQICQIGVGVIGQTAKITPGDRRLYLLREEIKEVEVQAHIAASILSKKLAAGATHVSVLLTSGRGAIIQTEEEAWQMGKLLRSVWEALGEGYTMSIDHCDMRFPLGRSIGNALAVREHLQLLRGESFSHDLHQAVLQLSANAIYRCGMDSSLSDARVRASKVLQEGAAALKYVQMLEAQGAEVDIDRIKAEDPSWLPVAEHQIGVRAVRDGVYLGADAQLLGKLVNDKLAGPFRTARGELSPKFDPSAGVVLEVEPRDEVQKGDLLATVHSNDHARAEAAIAELTPLLQPYTRWIDTRFRD